MQPNQIPPIPFKNPYFSIDVECVATGHDHNSRAVAQVSLVNQYEQAILNLYVKPDKPVVSYLTPLTGITKELLEQYGIPLEEAVKALKANLPTNSILVGQSIGQDVTWLGLKEGVDFAGLQDLAGLYRVWNPQFKSWSVFGQDQVAKVLLQWGSDPAGHNALMDAIKSIRLFNHYHLLRSQGEGPWQQAQQALLTAEPSPSFAKRNPVFEGVCMGNRRQCSCGAPFFS